MAEIRNLLDEEIKVEMADLALLELGSEEKLKGIEGIERLHKLRVAEQEMENNIYDSIQEKKNREEDKQERDLDRKIKIGLEVGAIVIPLIFTGIWLGKGFKFEETGVFTSQTNRGLFQKVFKSIK